MNGIALLILIIPAAVFLFIGLSGRSLKAGYAGKIGTAGAVAGALFSYILAYRYFFVLEKIDGIYRKIVAFPVEWLNFTDDLHIDFGIYLTPISVMMLAVITTVSCMVHIFSIEYMRGEKGFQRYYAFLSLFSFSMLGLVVATNIFQMYMFWELVGVSSYLLIGFYYSKPEAVAAAKKAFIITRFADLGFLVGILILSYHARTFDFETLTSDGVLTTLKSGAAGSFIGISAISWAMALIFIGGAGKSAMFPLHVWLPDAMEGPTPVSALIHAATMVVAGVYMLAVLFPVYSVVTPAVLTVIAYIGTFTALFAAIVAIAQTDIKRVLAFSTISQIAYMMTALGVSGFAGNGQGYAASMFHLFTHAFFKALLFLCAGAIIHAIHSNEMGKMGNLRKYMPVTHIAFLVACLSISGIPPFSGFFSKDEILTAVFNKDKLLFFTLLFVAGLTAFYMFRLYYRIFTGAKREYQHIPHEAPKLMLFPLTVLAILTCVSGFIRFDSFMDVNAAHEHLNIPIAVAGVVFALAGIITARFLYRNGNEIPAKITGKYAGLYKIVFQKFYIDELWIFFTKNIVFSLISKPVAWFDKKIIDGVIIDGFGRMTEKTSRYIRNFQSGQIQFYAFVFLFGTLFIAVWALLSTVNH
ncbi:MAG: NADH-quinone oxidoreductase subunit L [Prevotellaceae bacterium]|nr:NADH-quinone oxidoreductase subunit L [Prevotellaceae bacterium]